MTEYSRAELAFIVSGVGALQLVPLSELMRSIAAFTLLAYAAIAMYNHIQEDSDNE